MNILTESPRYSCALGGALSTAKALHRVIPILHCGPGCGMMLYNGQNFIAGYSGGGYVGGATVPSTNTYERDIVFGAEKRLRQTIASTIEVMDGDLYVVLTGCTAEIIGDDVPSIVAEFAEQHVPVAHASTGGFSGTNYHGYEKLWEALAQQVAVAGPRAPHLVNLFGMVPAQDIYWLGNTEEIARLLGLLGLTVNTFVTQRQGVEQVKQSARAALNIVLSPWLAEGVLTRYQQKFGVPSLRYPGPPIGPTATAEFLRAVAAALNLDSATVERVIAAEDQYTYDYFDRAGMVFTGFGIQHRIAVIGDSSTVTGVLRFLVNDFSQIPAVAVITDAPPEAHRPAIIQTLTQLEYAAPPPVVFTSDQWSVAQAVKAAGATYILGSSLDKEIAQDLGVPQLSISFPVSDRLVLNRAYAGYRGSITLVEDFISPCVAAL